MSEFTNPADGAAAAGARYVTATLALLGDRDPRSVLGATPDALRALTGPLDEPTLRRPEAPGKWGPLEVVKHLADSELVWANRLRFALAEERPVLAGYDQDAWVRRLRYRDASPEKARRQFEVLRELNLDLLDGLPPEDLARVALHAERGEESVAFMVRLYAGHDLVHLRQLERILRAP